MAALRFRSGGTWGALKQIKAKQGGSWVSPRAVMVRVNGAWQNVWSAFSATATGGDYTVDNGRSNTPRTRATAVGVAAFPQGGSGSYSYAWSVTGTRSVTSVSLANANAQGCTVYATCTLNTRGSVDLQCVVTDNGLGLQAVVTTSTSYNYYNTI